MRLTYGDYKKYLSEKEFLEMEFLESLAKKASVSVDVFNRYKELFTKTASAKGQDLEKKESLS